VIDVCLQFLELLFDEVNASKIESNLRSNEKVFKPQNG
jgi:hypothetical protein